MKKVIIAGAIIAGTISISANAEPLFEVDERLVDIEVRQQAKLYASRAGADQADQVAEEVCSGHISDNYGNGYTRERCLSVAREEFSATARMAQAHAEARQRQAESARAERERRDAEHQRKQQERAESRQRHEEQMAANWRGAPPLERGQTSLIDSEFGGVYSRPGSSTLLRVGAERGQIFIKHGRRFLNPVLDSIDRESRSFNFRIDGERLATLQRSPNMAVLTGYGDPEYWYFVRQLTEEDRDTLGMLSSNEVPAGSHLTASQVKDITLMMLDAYHDEQAEEMYRTEMLCWKDAPVEGEQRHAILEACAVSNFAATVIEDLYADSDERQPHAEYVVDRASDRILSQWYAHGIEEEQLSDRLVNAVNAHMPTIGSSLQAEGL